MFWQHVEHIDFVLALTPSYTYECDGRHPHQEGAS